MFNFALGILSCIICELLLSATLHTYFIVILLSFTVWPHYTDLTMITLIKQRKDRGKGI